ncbi:hypothetical protein F2Q69_00033496 [Brassica cretica]|uniref:Uncharacterized protein n=1 Tax=Brassica cretica TaxID=69181 RepID=A0A8S9SUX2_BRACR|nr:hypothetical protein F2Q69_00033496 [Brassica cretica]
MTTPPCPTINANNAIAAPSPSGMVFRGKRLVKSSSRGLNLPTKRLAWSLSSPGRFLSSPVASSSSSAAVTSNSTNRLEALEEGIEKVIYQCRFMAFLGTLGSLLGSVLCFIKGCLYVADSFVQYSVNRGKVILLLVEAIDTYLLGTVMLVFGMGLYELFISNLTTSETISHDSVSNRSSLFGMFPLKERPQWLEVKTVSELKTKLGHVIVMLLLIGLFDKSRKVAITSVADLLYSFVQYSVNRGKVILLLVEAIDTYLLGTVMLVFGMGLYELFISNLTTSETISHDSVSNRSSLFGMFPLKERPQWLEVKTVSELKTKLGHVIVMLLLIGLFDKSRKVAITSVADLLCISASIFLSSACLFLLSRLNGSH